MAQSFPAHVVQLRRAAVDVEPQPELITTGSLKRLVKIQMGFGIAKQELA